MKVHYLQVLVIDHDHLGVNEVERILEDANYPNDCIAPSVIKSQSAEIGNWDDDNPLNHSDTQAAEVDRLFSAWQPIETAPQNTSILVWSAERGTELVSALFFRKPLPTHWIPLPNPPEARC